MKKINIGKKASDKRIEEASGILERYKNGKINLESRIVEEEKAWRLQMWQKSGENNGVTPSSSAYMWNAVVNKHADMMDSYPVPYMLPREESDIKEATMLTDIIPVILDRNDFEETYSEGTWYKLKHGSACYGVFWDVDADYGIGDITVKNIDLLNLFWDPTVSDIQKSPNLFICAAMDTDILKERYPDKEIMKDAITLSEYEKDDQVDRSNQTLVVDWYYKKRVNGKTVLHYCKYTGGTVLYSSEDDPLYKEKGYYDHGLYPVVIDTLYPEADRVTGYGIISVTKDAQEYIDCLDALIMEYTKKATTPRWFKKKDVGINEKEFSDWSKPFVSVAGDISEERFHQISLNPLSGIYYKLLERKIYELKENIGNRDVNSGGTQGGVTSGAAIATLQEAGNKTSRDMIKTSYRAYVKIINLVIELIRQFYTNDRTFRIVRPNEGEKFITYSNKNLVLKDSLGPGGVKLTDHEGNALKRKPIFDISVKAQKTNPYSKLSQNETASNLYKMGIFDPQNSQQALLMLSMMDFDGKDEIVSKISNLENENKKERRRFMKEDFDLNVFDEEFKKNREFYKHDPEKAHGDQVKLVEKLDRETGRKSKYDEATGVWELSDGRRSDEFGTGSVGNSYLSPVFDFRKSESYDDYEDASEKYKNTEFKYNPEKDKNYKRYKSQREKAGKKAMEDTLGKLSSMTGGIAGSYAVSAAGGAYNDYMDDAADKMTDFYNMAYDEFQDKQDRYLDEMVLAEKEIEKERELWESERDRIKENEAREKAGADYILMMQDFTEKGWDGLGQEQKILALTEGWYDPDTGILYDGAGNSYKSKYNPVQNAIATYKTKGLKGLSADDVEYLEYEGYKIRDGILYAPDWREV